MNIWSFILSKTKEKQRLILIVVIDNTGSSPGKKGFKMAISEDGTLHGSIGGGMMENNLVNIAIDKIKRKDEEIILKHEDHYTESNKEKSVLKKYGSQTLALIPITSGYIKKINNISTAISSQESAIIEYSNTGIHLQKTSDKETKFAVNIESDSKWEFLEATGIRDKLFLFGAGHVGLALSRICSLLEFEIHLFDNRNKLNTFNDNELATTKQVIDYSDIGDLVEEGNNSFAVIMSHTHEEDEIILGQLLGKNLKYLGMLASRKKINKIKSNLIAKGHQEKLFEKLHAPIGVDINSQTPIEIAVSIASEMIRVKNS